jgi:hypothetical protein
VLAEVVLPYLHELGEAWGRGEATVAQEHFASALLRGRLLGLARGWGGGSGPHALPTRRAARPGTDRLRAGAARARLADHLPGPGHAAGSGCRASRAALAARSRPGLHPAGSGSGGRACSRCEGSSRRGSRAAAPPASSRTRPGPGCWARAR